MTGGVHFNGPKNELPSSDRALKVIRAANNLHYRGERRRPARKFGADQRRVLPAAGARKNWRAQGCPCPLLCT